MNLSNYIFNLNGNNETNPGLSYKNRTGTADTQFWNRRKLSRPPNRLISDEVSQRPHTREHWQKKPKMEVGIANRAFSQDGNRFTKTNYNNNQNDIEAAYKLQQPIQSDYFSTNNISTLHHLKNKVLQIIILSKNDKEEASRLLQQLTFMTQVPVHGVNRTPLEQSVSYSELEEQDLNIAQLGTSIEQMQSYLRSSVKDLAQLRNLIAKLQVHFLKVNSLSYQQRQRKLALFQEEKKKQCYISESSNFFVKPKLPKQHQPAQSQSHNVGQQISTWPYSQSNQSQNQGKEGSNPTSKRSKPDDDQKMKLKFIRSQLQQQSHNFYKDVPAHMKPKVIHNGILLRPVADLSQKPSVKVHQNRQINLRAVDIMVDEAEDEFAQIEYDLAMLKSEPASYHYQTAGRFGLQEAIIEEEAAH